jgi:hypothetical protein
MEILAGKDDMIAQVVYNGYEEDGRRYSNSINYVVEREWMYLQV